MKFKLFRRQPKIRENSSRKVEAGWFLVAVQKSVPCGGKGEQKIHEKWWVGGGQSNRLKATSIILIGRIFNVNI